MKLQVKEGIDAVIVDNVLAIRKGLTGSDDVPASAAANKELPLSSAANANANGALKSSTSNSNGVLVGDAVLGLGGGLEDGLNLT